MRPYTPLRKPSGGYGPSQKIGNVGQVANLPKTRQIGNLPHVGMLHIYCDGPYRSRLNIPRNSRGTKTP
jgi:hypothetical protein